jgi:hypothetical protein
LLAFLDTEFTDLAIWPRLLSVGIVTDHGSDREFYAEVTDPELLDATHRFGRGAVLPQFGRVADAACTYAELGARLSVFLHDRVADLRLNESVELAFGYHLDWELIDRAMMETVPTSWTSTRRRIRPVNVHEIAGSGLGHVAAEAYFKSQVTAPVSRHHALCDARALRLAYEAGVRAFVPLNQPPMLSERKFDGRPLGKQDIQFAHE